MMTDKDIIKALKIHADNEADCSGCPIYHSDTGETCAYELAQNALDLINRLQERKEYYKNNRNEYQDKVMFISKQCDELQEENSRQKAEVERLKRSEEGINKIIDNLCNIQTARAEAITEFAERLKEKMNDVAKCSFCGKTYFVIGEPFIDQIAKEMKGE